MEHESPRSPPPAATPDRSHWTPAKQRLFLTALLESGSVARAARSVGMSRSSAHRLRARLAGTVFDRNWAQVLRMHVERLADPFGTETESQRASHDHGDPAGEWRQ